MFVGELETEIPGVKLIAPDISRDAALGVKWLSGDEGRETLRLMGVTDANNHPTTLEAESARVHDFLHKQNQYNWMIALSGQVVGTIWVELNSRELHAPSVHLMIGETAARGQGVGTAALKSVLAYLKSRGDKTVYSRYMIQNEASRSLLAAAGFATDGQAYTDADGLGWQNVRLRLDS